MLPMTRIRFFVDLSRNNIGTMSLIWLAAKMRALTMNSSACSCFATDDVRLEFLQIILDPAAGVWGGPALAWALTAQQLQVDGDV